MLSLVGKGSQKRVNERREKGDKRKRGKIYFLTKRKIGIKGDSGIKGDRFIFDACVR